jgi:hypothetical protein
VVHVRVAEGSRRIVLVTGEAGIEQYGEGEGYRPVLEALGNLARSAAGGELGAVLRRHAPTWAAQVSAIAPEGGAALSPRRSARSPAHRDGGVVTAVCEEVSGGRTTAGHPP